MVKAMDLKPDSDKWMSILAFFCTETLLFGNNQVRTLLRVFSTILRMCDNFISNPTVKFSKAIFV